MCGIAGIMTSAGLPSDAALKAMMNALRHRGPDGDGQYMKDDTALAQVRLAIIDLETGNQPLYGPDDLALVANGEIYNYIELREELPGTNFATKSDCELPLHLYRKHGLDFPARLRGMYAVALHDPAAGRLVLSRDPFGIKPLYYAETAQGFAFASEPHALIASGFVKPVLAPQARNELLQLQFTTGRETIFEGIHRMLPGETLVVVKGRIAERRRLDAFPAGGVAEINEEEALKELDRVWADSVNIHQRSDVPYGMFLSGGIDSSAVLAMMARLNRRPVRAFTIGFPGTRAADERTLAREVAKSLGAEHTEIEFGEDDFWKTLPAVARVMDDPAADYATLPTYKLAATARAAGLKVVLSGEGGDELFGGYGRYRRAMRPWWIGGRKMRAAGTLDGLGILREELSGWREGMQKAEQAAERPERTRLQMAQATDSADWLPNDLLGKLDRCLMAHGLEGRTPFLEPMMAAFAFRLPDRLKVHGKMGKWILRRWVAQHAAAAAPFSRKRGFTVPVGEWIAKKGARLGPLVAKQESVRAVCKPEAVENLFRNASGKNESFAAWTLLFYALWHRHHIEAAFMPPDVFTALGEKA